MSETIKVLLPKLGLSQKDVTLITHDGVSELERSLPKKLKAWRDPAARFLVLRDNDGGDCVARKRKLADIATGAGRGDRTVVRIVCQELEAWFLGDSLLR